MRNGTVSEPEHYVHIVSAVLLDDGVGCRLSDESRRRGLAALEPNLGVNNELVYCRLIKTV